MNEKNSEIYELKTLIGRLTSENSYLVPQAAAELAHAWMLCKATLCIQAAYLCLQQGDIVEAKRWLDPVNDEAQAEMPDDMTVPGLQRWFDSNMIACDGKGGFLTLQMATEAIKATFPATARQINLLKAEGVEMAIDSVLKEDTIAATAVMKHLMLSFAAQLRQGGAQ